MATSSIRLFWIPLWHGTPRFTPNLPKASSRTLTVFDDQASNISSSRLDDDW